MKQYNFDEIIDRTGTDSIKYDALGRFFGAGDILPLWVADTDFRTPDFIMEAIRKRMEHEVLGYTFRGEEFSEAIISWVKRRHNWDIREEWISFSPGVVSALTAAVMTLTSPGDKIIVQPPVYFPFFETIRGTDRKMVENPLKLVNGRYYFDLEDLEEKLDDETRMLLLCNPHNPGGMVWKREELSALEAVCKKKNIIVVSDEIHSDLLFKGETHIPWAMLSEESEQNSIVCMAPSKTFNVAGLSTSFAVIPNPRQKKIFDKLLNTLHIHMGNIPGKVALEAAYSHGHDWLSQMMVYVEENFRFLDHFISEHLPRIKVMKPEATFLVWLDFREYGMNDKKLSSFLVEKAKLGLNNGARFGTGGDGFQRINIGCPRSVLKEALERMAAAFNQLP
jgi:cysteine-S-conjugate beta-lyase